MEMIPQPPEWTDRAPVKISASREIMASPDEIFTALADHESWPQWFSQLTKIERFGELDEGIGSQRRAFVNKVEIDEEFIEWEPGTVWGFTVTAVRGVPSMIESMSERVCPKEQVQSAFDGRRMKAFIISTHADGNSAGGQLWSPSKTKG